MAWNGRIGLKVNLIKWKFQLKGELNLSKYKYSNPIERGYTMFRLTKRQHNNLFKYRQIKWSDRYDYYP